MTMTMSLTLTCDDAENEAISRCPSFTFPSNTHQPQSSQSTSTSFIVPNRLSLSTRLYQQRSVCARICLRALFTDQIRRTAPRLSRDSHDPDTKKWSTPNVPLSETRPTTCVCPRYSTRTGWMILPSRSSLFKAAHGARRLSSLFSWELGQLCYSSSGLELALTTES